MNKIKFIIHSFFILFLTNFVFSSKVMEETTYPWFKYLFENQHEAETKLTNRIYIRYCIPKKLNSGITHIQFADIKLKNINKDKYFDLRECTQSKKISVEDGHPPFSMIKEINTLEYIGVSFGYGYYKESNHDTKTGYLSSFMKSMEDFDDYRATFTVKCFNKAGEMVFSRKMEALQSRYYQKKEIGFFGRLPPRNWSPGACRVFIDESRPLVKIETDDYNKNVIITILHYGKFVIKENKIIFEENNSKREAFYNKYIRIDHFIAEDGLPDSKRIYERIDVDAKKYPYINIYDSDYYSSKKK